MSTAITTYQNRLAASMGRSLTIKNLPLRLVERGRIKIGEKGQMVTSKTGKQFQPPQKLDHFVITGMARGQDGNFLPDRRLMSVLQGDEPKLTRIPVRLLFDEPSLNFQSRLVAYSGTDVWCHGDGETAEREGKPRACPCPNVEPAYPAMNGESGPKCKMNGRLSVIIDGAATVGGVWTFRTTSYNSILGITSAMDFFLALTGGKLAGLPLDLVLAPKTGKRPDGGAVTVFVVSLEYRGPIEQLREYALRAATAEAQYSARMAELHSSAKALIEAPVAPAEREEREEIVAEFYPQQMGADVDPDTGEVATEPAKELESVKAENGRRKIPLYAPDGTVEAEYETYGEWVKGLDKIAGVEGVLGRNWDQLEKIAKSPRTPADIKELAGALMEAANSGLPLASEPAMDGM